MNKNINVKDFSYHSYYGVTALIRDLYTSLVYNRFMKSKFNNLDYKK